MKRRSGALANSNLPAKRLHEYRDACRYNYLNDWSISQVFVCAINQKLVCDPPVVHQLRSLFLIVLLMRFMDCVVESRTQLG